jgi:hypothetical protein
MASAAVADELQRAQHGAAVTKSATQTIWVSDEGQFDLLFRHSGGRCKVADGGSPNNAR